MIRVFSHLEINQEIFGGWSYLRHFGLLWFIIDVFFYPIVVWKGVFEAVDDESEVAPHRLVVTFHRVIFEWHFADDLLNGPGRHSHFRGPAVDGEEAFCLASVPTNLHGLSIDFDVVQLDTKHQFVKDGVPNHVARVF